MVDTKQLLMSRMQALTPALDEAIAWAIIRAETRATGLDHDRFPHLRPMTIRADVRLALEDSTSLHGWQVAGDSRKMAQLLLEDQQTGLELRFLKSPFSQPDRIPHAGQNQARRRTWSQRPLPLAAPGQLIVDTGLAGVTLLLLWSYQDATQRTEGFDLRIVHTLEPGAFGRATVCDLDLVVPRSGILREEDLRFVVSEEEEDLFLIDVPADDELGS